MIIVGSGWVWKSNFRDVGQVNASGCWAYGRSIRSSCVLFISPALERRRRKSSFSFCSAATCSSSVSTCEMHHQVFANNRLPGNAMRHDTIGITEKVSAVSNIRARLRVDSVGVVCDQHTCAFFLAREVAAALRFLAILRALREASSTATGRSSHAFLFRCRERGGGKGRAGSDSVDVLPGEHGLEERLLRSSVASVSSSVSSWQIRESWLNIVSI